MKICIEAIAMVHSEVQLYFLPEYAGRVSYMYLNNV